MAWFLKTRRADGQLTVWDKSGTTEELIATIHSTFHGDRKDNAALIRDAPIMHDLLKLVREQALQIPDCQLIVGMITEHLR